MTAFEGDVCVVSQVSPDFVRGELRQKDDHALYSIQGRSRGSDFPSNYDWASSMLEAVETPLPSYILGQKVRIRKKTLEYYGEVHFTKEMSEHRGEVHTIADIEVCPGAYREEDDFYIYKLHKTGNISWTKSMLEPIEETQKSEEYS